MRNKIDNLTLFNLLWFAMASMGNILLMPMLLLIAFAGAFCTIIHELYLMKVIRKNIETQYQPKLFRRVRYHLIFTIAFVLFTALDFVF